MMHTYLHTFILGRFFPSLSTSPLAVSLGKRYNFIKVDLRLQTYKLSIIFLDCVFLDKVNLQPSNLH